MMSIVEHIASPQKIFGSFAYESMLHTFLSIVRSILSSSPFYCYAFRTVFLCLIPCFLQYSSNEQVYPPPLCERTPLSDNYV